MRERVQLAGPPPTDDGADLPASQFARDTLQVQRSRWFDWLVRAGFAARGLTYAIIGGLAAALAVGAGSDGTSANQQGALALIAQAPLGKVLVAGAAAGLLAYAMWKVGLGVIGTGPEGGGGRGLKDRAANLGAAVVYLVFFAVAFRVVTGSAGSDASENRTAAGVLGWPAGRLLVGAAGVGLIAISIYQCYEALRDKFADDNKLCEMSEPQHRAFLVVGRIGLVARALVFILVGYFLCRTAIRFKASGGIGIDGTLAEVHQQPYGNWLLALTAAGLEIFALFSFFETRYQRL